MKKLSLLVSSAAILAAANLPALGEQEKQNHGTAGHANASHANVGHANVGHNNIRGGVNRNAGHAQYGHSQGRSYAGHPGGHTVNGHPGAHPSGHGYAHNAPRGAPHGVHGNPHGYAHNAPHGGYRGHDDIRTAHNRGYDHGGGEKTAHNGGGRGGGGGGGGGFHFGSFAAGAALGFVGGATVAALTPHSVDVWDGGHWEYAYRDGYWDHWWIVNGVWYGYPTVYVGPPPVVSTVIYEPVQVAYPVSFWYYCDPLQQYYPVTQTCPVAWRQFSKVGVEPPDYENGRQTAENDNGDQRQASNDQDDQQGSPQPKQIAHGSGPDNPPPPPDQPTPPQQQQQPQTLRR
jgi:hypothetical protein